MKKLKIFLLVSLVFSVFIPKTQATTIDNFEMLFSANIYTVDGNFSTEVLDGNHLSIYGGIPVFYGYQINNLNFSKICDTSYGYRVDYQIWGVHNTNVDWVKYAKLISINNPDITTIGTIISVDNHYTLNLSTYFYWTPSYCPVDSITSLTFNVDDYFRDPISSNFFYNPDYSGARTNYYIYDKLFSDIDINLANQLVGNYYSGRDYTQELDQIKGEIIHVNDKLEETNQKLDNLYSNISQTNDKLDSVNSSIKETQDYLKDDTAPSADINVLGNVQGILPEGPVDSLLNIPFKVLSILNSSFGGVCVPISGKFVFDSTLTIPCFSDLFYENVPDGIMVFINVVPTAFILIAYLKNLYKRVDRALSLETSADDEWGGI